MICVFKCPFCGDEMKYNSETHLLECSSCESTMRVEDYDYSLMTYDDKTIISEELSGFTCPNCGSSVIVGKTQATVTCPYCTKSMAVFGLGENELEPEMIIPFKLDERMALGKLLTWWEEKESMPKFDLKRLNITFTETYIPVWLYSSDVHVGMDAKVAPFEASRKSVDFTSDIFEIHKEVSSSFKQVPIVASAKTNSKIFHEIEPYDYSELTNFNPAYLSGHMAERYYLSHEDASPKMVIQLQKYGVDQCKTSVETDKVGGTILNSHVTDLQVIPKDVVYALVPIWICSYKYNGKEHQIFINGQTGKTDGEVLYAGKKLYTELILFMIASIFCVTPIVGIIWETLAGNFNILSLFWFGLLVPAISLGSILDKRKQRTSNGEYYVDVRSRIDINDDIQYKQGARFQMAPKLIARAAIGLFVGAIWIGIIIPTIESIGGKTRFDFVAMLAILLIAGIDTYLYLSKRSKFYARRDTVDYYEYIKAGTCIEKPAVILKTNF